MCETVTYVESLLDRLLEVDLSLSLQEISDCNEVVLLFQLD